MNRNNITNLLDKTRINNSAEEMKNLFSKLINDNNEEALKLLNDDKVSFTTLFLLQNKLKDQDIVKKLSLKNKIALEFSKGIKTDNRIASLANVLSTDYIEATKDTLKWILETGYVDDGLNDEFDEILDVAAILLIKKHNESSELSTISKLIFERHKKSYYTHDLVWAFFESCNPIVLQLIAEHLKSHDEKESKFASKLLSFIPGMSLASPFSNDEKYSLFTKWFEENKNFLYYTGESFQLTSEPIPYIVKLDAKYLCKRISTDKGEFLEPLTSDEHTLLKMFNKLNTNTQALLSSFSIKTYNENKTWWKEWIRYPLSMQIKVAKAKGGIS